MIRGSRTFGLVECCVGITAVYLASRWFGAWAAAAVSAGFFAVQSWRSADQSQSADRFERLSRTDDLTGLDNDRSFRDALTRRCAGLILFDLDGFKTFNDTEGHPAGDDALRMLGSVLREFASTYRVGGDEFAMIVSPEETSSLIELAEAIRRRIANHAWPLRPITASVGVARVGANFDSVDLRIRADQALYLAKRQGGNQVVVSTDNQS